MSNQPIANESEEFIKNINDNLLIFFNDLVFNFKNNYDIVESTLSGIKIKIDDILSSNDSGKFFFDRNDLDFFSSFVTQINLINENFKIISEKNENKKEIFLTYDFKELVDELKRIDVDSDYLAQYYLLLIKIIFFVWKNEINLLDESMSYHHRNKSVNDVTRIYQELIDNEKVRKLEDKVKNEFNALMEYIRFFLFKFDNWDGKIAKNDVLNYLEYINFIDLYETNRYDSIYPKNSELDLFLKFNYYKKNKFKDEFSRCYDKLKNLYKTYCTSFKAKNRIFFLNNLISVLWNDSFEVEFLIEEKQYIHQELSSIEEHEYEASYFTYYKLSKLNRVIWEKTKKLSYFKEAHKYINEAIQKFEKNDGAYYPFDISDLKNKDNSTSIFTFSWPFIPQKTDYHLRLKQEQYFIISKESEIRIKNKEKDFDMKIEKNSTKTVEILAIFSAIILFVSWSIQIFQYLSDLKSAIYFIIWFSAALTFFIILILFVTKGPVLAFSKNKFLYLYLWWYLFIVLFITFWNNYFSTSIPLINEKFKDDISDKIIKEIEQKLNIYSNISDKSININQEVLSYPQTSSWEVKNSWFSNEIK